MTALEQLKTLPQVNVLLLNLVADEEINQQILQYLVGKTNQPNPVVNRAPTLGEPTVSSTAPLEPTLPEIVVRCLPAIGNTFDSSLYWETDLSDAIRRAIALGKQKEIRA